ncbi:aminoglycoside phosphotransferase family protein [Deinococcus sonorensis]|uniref:Aminoglycoside phosphotransferase family protein n=2 Tax=Deinococcus sonorensis TaxID=309891 RepID=A0AAU7UBY2_9DEIO
MISLPASFLEVVRQLNGEAGLRWAASLPQQVAHLCEQWGLQVTDPAIHGAMSLVVPVQREQQPCVLKLSWLRQWHEQEVAALRAWNGRGAVLLLDDNPECSATLLERLDAGRTLMTLSVAHALEVAAQLIARLTVPAPAAVGSLDQWAEQFASDATRARWQATGQPCSVDVLSKVQHLAADLGPSSGRQLVHRDLWYGNVLAGHREPWLAIDPMVVAGAPEFGLAQLLWTRLDDIEAAGGVAWALQRLCAVAELDPALARAWTLVRCVDYWLWGLEVGLTLDPARCRRIVEVLQD